MKTSTKNKSIIAAIAAVMSIASISSCSNDSPSAFNAAPQQGFGAVTGAGSITSGVAKQTTHYMGDTIKKHIEGYGDAVFTCISSTSPYYFVHTSDHKYSAKEMDAMHYQQNPLAVDEKMLNNIADVVANDWARQHINITGDYDFDSVANYINDFKKLFTADSGHDSYLKRTLAHITMSTENFWVRDSNHDYPYGSMTIKVMKGDKTSKNVSIGYSPFYAFAGDNYMMFAFTE